MGGDQSYLPTLPDMINTVEQKVSTDLMFHLSIFTDEQMAEMDKYYEEFGVTSFKFYMAGVKGVFPGVSDGFIFEGFQKIAGMGDRAIGCVHCEDQSMLDIAFDKVAAKTPNGTLTDWAQTAPKMAEEEAIMRAYYLCDKAGSRALHRPYLHEAGSRSVSPDQSKWTGFRRNHIRLPLRLQ